MIKRLIEYLTIERKTEYIQYKSSLKLNNARNCISYSTLKTISIKISTNLILIHNVTFFNQTINFLTINFNVIFLLNSIFNFNCQTIHLTIIFNVIKIFYCLIFFNMKLLKNIITLLYSITTIFSIQLFHYLTKTKIVRCQMRNV